MTSEGGAAKRCRDAAGGAGAGGSDSAGAGTLRALATVFGVEVKDLEACLEHQSISDPVLHAVGAVIDAKTKREEKKKFKKWILKEWQTCAGMRDKVEWEGDGYFYNDYTNVPCSWDMYQDCVSGTCFCGKCK